MKNDVVQAGVCDKTPGSLWNSGRTAPKCRRRNACEVVERHGALLTLRRKVARGREPHRSRRALPTLIKLGDLANSSIAVDLANCHATLSTAAADAADSSTGRAESVSISWLRVKRRCVMSVGKNMPHVHSTKIRIAAECGPLRQVIGAPQEPRRQPRQRNAEEVGHALLVADRGHRAAHLVGERAGWAAGKDGAEIGCEMARLPNGELRHCRCELVVARVRDERTVTDRPHAKRVAHGQIGIDHDAAFKGSAFSASPGIRSSLARLPNASTSCA